MNRFPRIVQWLGLLACLLAATVDRAQCEGVAAAPWPRVYEGLCDNDLRLLYAGAVDGAVPAFADLDGDGDLDLVLGRADGYPFYFRNDGTSTAPHWTFVPGGLGLTGLGTAPRYTAPALADLDGDGRPDLLLGLGDGRTAHYRNDGSPTSWTLVSDNILGAPLPGHARPALGDLDNVNGRGTLDLIVGGAGFSGDYLAYYRNDGATTAPLWTAVNTIDFANIHVAGNAMPCLADLDGDGDADLLVGTGDGRVEYYRNFGPPDLFAFSNIPTSSAYAGVAAGNSAAPAVADFMGLRRFDLLVGSEAGALLRVANLGSASAPVWALPAALWTSLDTGSESAPEVGDIDGDGNPDLLVGATNNALPGGYGIAWFRNEGAPWLPNWHLVTRQIAGLQAPSPAPCLADLRATGQPDLVVGDADGLVRFLWNRGAPGAPDFRESTTATLTVAACYWVQPALADGDDDGDLDLFVAGLDALTLSSGRLFYIENVGTAAAPAWAPPAQWVDLTADLDVDAFAFPSVAASDVDGDGLADLVLSDGEGTTYLRRCLHRAPGLVFSAAAVLDSSPDEPLQRPALGDLDGDGRPDLLLGSLAGGVRQFRNPSAAFTVAPHHGTVATGSPIDFRTSATAAGSWVLQRNGSGGAIDPATGRYTAGTQAGIDEVRFTDGATSWGTAYVNVLTPAQFGSAGKAVILAGRKAGDSLWPATNYLANSVYRLLRYRGYARENIAYLNPDALQDADGDGNAANDIAAPASLAAAESALTAFAQGAPSLAVYLIDHGQEESNAPFVRCNESEVLYASVLDRWLDALQASGTTTLTLVVDCCQSGGFLRECHATGAQRRIVIASASEGQPAFFPAGGLISFTGAFCEALYGGVPVGSAFSLAADGMSRYQTAQLDDDGDGVYTPGRDGALAARVTWGSVAAAGADRPQIGSLSPNRTLAAGATTAGVWAADVVSVRPVRRVWATVAAPSALTAALATPAAPVTTLPEIDMPWNPATQRYEAVVAGLTEPGAYAVTVHAQDVWDNLAYSKVTYLNRPAADARAIVLCADGAFGPGAPWAASDFVAAQARRAALARWIPAERIAFLGSAPRPAEVTGPPTRAALQSAIAAAAGADRLTVFLVGGGDAERLDLDGDGGAAEPTDLTPGDLAAWLDALQSADPVHPTRVTVVLDFSRSGAWLPALAAPAGRERIVIASCGADQAAACAAGGAVSFGDWLFGQAALGASYRESFAWARGAIRAASNGCQEPVLDDNGTGASTPADGALAAVTWLGAPFVTESERVTIGSYAHDVVTTGTQAQLWASGVWAAEGVGAVYAIVVPPGSSLTSGSAVRVDLAYSTATSRWQAVWDGFDPAAVFQVVYYAEARDGARSAPYATAFGPAPSPDRYDVYDADNDPATTHNFLAPDARPQPHNLCSPGDQDWAAFHAAPGHWYTVRAAGQEAHCDAAIALYRADDLTTMARPVADDEPAGGPDEWFSWYSGATEGTMLVCVSQSPRSPGLGATATSYTLSVTGDWGDNVGLATISGVNSQWIRPAGSTLVLPQNPPPPPAPTASAPARPAPAGVSQYLYTRHAVAFPAGAVDRDVECYFAAPADLGPTPYYAPTQQWVAAHPGNAAIVQIQCNIAGAVPLAQSVTVTMEFVNDGPSIPGVFAVDDLPTGTVASQMRIHRWNGTAWEVVPSAQTVGGTTVTCTVALDALLPTDNYFAAAPVGPAPPATPAAPSPADGATSVSVFAGLAWDATANATSYTLALWHADEAEPAVPTASGLTNPAYTPAPALGYATAWLWRVTAHGPGGATAGPVWSFATEDSSVCPCVVSVRILSARGARVVFSRSMAASANLAANYTVSGPGLTGGAPVHPASVSTPDGLTYLLAWDTDVFVAGGGAITVSAAHTADAVGHPLREPMSGTDGLAERVVRAATWTLR